MAQFRADPVPVSTAPYSLPTASDLREPEPPGLHNGMTPVTFDGCFGWFHPGQANRLPVLLCAPLGREARWTHRTYRKLASKLAAAGSPVLRFDYPGAGDSCELPPGADPVGAWLDSVHTAADWLRAQTGASGLAMAGLRFGATLAANAAVTRQDVTTLILLAPVVTGRAYAREMKTLARMGERPRQDGTIELDGLVLTAAILETLAATTMPQTMAAKTILLLDTAQSARAPYSETLSRLGSDVTTLPFDGYAELMNSAVTNKTPMAALEQITAWVTATDLARPNPYKTATPTCPPPLLYPAGCVEQPITFGAGHRLFGVLCRPDGQTATSLVLIGNSGGDPHTGIGRFAVMLARGLAEKGIASFRLDFAGLGDSLLGPDDADSHLYATDRRGDFAAAIDILTPLGFTDFGVFGLCTGAFHALQATVADARIGVVAMVNLATFTWDAANPISILPQTQLRASASYRKALLNRKIWRRILRGDVAVGAIASVLLKRATTRAVMTGAYAMERFGLARHAERRPRSIMRSLSKRGVKSLSVLSFEDPGIDALEAHFGPNARILTELPGATVTQQDHMDHTLSMQDMREDAVRIVADFFAGAVQTDATPDRGDHGTA